MRLIHFSRFSLEKCGKIWKNQPFFWADMAGLGKYCMGGYGRIGVYRVKCSLVITTCVLMLYKSPDSCSRYHAALRKMKEIMRAHGGRVMSLNASFLFAYQFSANAFW